MAFPKSLLFGPAVWVLVLLASIGCGKYSAQEEPPDDEAMRRLIWENQTYKQNKSKEEAAQEYFLPKYYFDPEAKEGSGVKDYFHGMDRVVVAPGWDREGPPLNTPVFQLATPDQSLPTFHIETSPLFTNQEILGRNTWLMWCGGNEGFWDWLGTDSLGFIDLLKLIDSRKRSVRFDEAGVINEPGMMKSGGPDEFGLWLDIPTDGATRKRRADHLKRTFEAMFARKHPSQRGLYDDQGRGYASGYQSPAGAESYDATTGYNSAEEKAAEYGKGDYSKEDPPPEIYGFSTGVVGLRLFPNPRFDAEAREKWDADRYYNDESYWNDPKLVRPFRVGVACGFCHVSFHPLNPPRDRSEPSWDNISGNIGAQYLRIRAAFGNQLEPDNFVYHLLDSQPPGTIDTSLIASDGINNPNTMNAVFNLPQRVLLGLRNPPEAITAASASQPSIWRHPEPDYKPDPRAEQYENPVDVIPEAIRKILERQGLLAEAQSSNSAPWRRILRILLDGSDGIGPWGALARVYLNIGTYYEQWIRIQRTVIGFQPQRAFTITDCNRHSLYWIATQHRVAALRDYFLKISPSMPLLATAGGEQRIEPIDFPKLRARADREKLDYSQLLAREKGRHVDLTKLKRGRQVFARNCIVCHSSIQPESSAITFQFDDPAKKLEYEQTYEELIKRRTAMRKNDSATGEFWEHNPAQWLDDPLYMAWAEDAVDNYPEFWQLNFLSTDYRIPINVVKTNSARAMATNALDQNMWDDFASESYQNLPSVGAIEYFNPYAKPGGAMEYFTPRHKVRNKAQAGGGGPGFYRVPSLVSIWATAPLLHNNSLGLFNNDPSIDGRLDAFDDAIRKLLWPERRLLSSSYNGATAERLQQDHGLIWRTPQECYLTISGRRVPNLLGEEVAVVMQVADRFPWLREIRPRWLPSAILLMASFLLLFLNSRTSRQRVGIASLLIALVAFAAPYLGSRPDWLGAIYPLWLPAWMLLGVGIVFLVIDHTQWLRTLAYVALIASVIGIVLRLAEGYVPYVSGINNLGPTGWFSCLTALAGIVLLLLHLGKSWRYAFAWILLVLAFAVWLVYVIDANAGEFEASYGWGAVWVAVPFLAAAALVLLTPDHRQLTRYVGYSSLVLSLAFGTLVYFFAGRLGDIRIGPIPAGTPVNLLANLNADADPQELKHALKVTLSTLAEIKSKNLTEQQTQELLRDRVAPALMQVNKCPDFVMDHGHYYDWFHQMTDDDKDALIELLKTF